jgi:hypothetical protein
MADLQFSRDEVAALAGKIGELDTRLSQKERVLLLAIFAAAAASVEPATRNHGALLAGAEIRQQESWPGDGDPDSGDDEREELGDLQRQLLNAYIPGNSFDSLGPIVMVKIIPGDTNGGNGP